MRFRDLGQCRGLGCGVQESLYNKSNNISSGFPNMTGFWCFKTLHLVDDKCETQGYIMAARTRTVDPKTCKNEDFGR